MNFVKLDVSRVTGFPVFWISSFLKTVSAFLGLPEAFAAAG
jgi:hypothetical protein